MNNIIQFVGPERALQVFGVKFLGVNWDNGKKLLFELALIVLMVLISKTLSFFAKGATKAGQRVAFWVQQGIHLLAALILICGTLSIWFTDPTRLATALGLVTAGLAFALQRVVTSVAGYLLILRGRTFNVGDRIVMGGVRGDVIELGFLQTRIMEMGEPPSVQAADPAMWVRSRQYTGRIVSVSNAQIFDEPVFNYTQSFPFIWEEMAIPVSFKDDRATAERILLEAARKNTLQITQLGEPVIREMEDRYVMKRSDMEPRVYWRITDNWLEMAVRFLVEDHGVREVKNRMSRDILAGFDAAGIGIASGTYDIVGLPPLRIERIPSAANGRHATADKSPAGQAFDDGRSQ